MNAPGTYLAVTRDGSAIAVADDVPEDPKPRVITTTRAIDVPAAPDGSRWLADASFDSAGVLQLQATADSGRTRTRFAFDPETGRLTPRP